MKNITKKVCTGNLNIVRGLRSTLAMLNILFLKDEDGNRLVRRIW